MRSDLPWLATLVLVAASRVCLAEVSIQFETSVTGSKGFVRASGLSEAERTSLAETTKSRLSRHLQLHVEGALTNDVNLPSVLGECRFDGQDLFFEPRFPLRAGQAYRAEFMSPLADSPKTVARLQIPQPPPAAPPQLVAAYPSTDTLPQNLLKFYLHFSAPMQQGNAYSFVAIHHANGERLIYPFLELTEELWDRTGTRLTLFLDPGRVKRGLVPREEDGAILEAGESYRLVVSGHWPSAAGVPLGEDFSKAFLVTGEDFEQPDPTTWKLIAPTADARAISSGGLEGQPPMISDPLTVRFPESLDHALLNRCLRVVNASRQLIDGEASVSDLERCWSFRPRMPWVAGEYTLVVAPVLEDLAGNSIGRAFEVDLSKPSAKATKDVFLEFTVP